MRVVEPVPGIGELMSDRYSIVCDQTLIATGDGAAPGLNDLITVASGTYFVIGRDWSWVNDTDRLTIRVTKVDGRLDD